MTYTDQKIDLIMNQMTRAQYEYLKSQGLTSENELYYITDDKSIENIISDYIPLSVTIGSQTNQNPLIDKQYVDTNFYKKNETSSATQIQNALENIDLTSYYKKTETSSSSQIKQEFERHYTKNETSSANQIDNQFQKYYIKSETSSAIQIQNAFDNIDFSDYYTKNETSSSQQLSSAFENKVVIKTWTKIGD